MTTVKIPKKLTGKDELVVISRKKLDALRAQASGEEPVTEKNILRWSREAKRLHKEGKLPRLHPRDL